MPENVKYIFLEMNLLKAKWLVYGYDQPSNQDNQYFFNHLGNALDKYTTNYKRFLLIGDFNAEDYEPYLSKFLHNYNAENIVKEKKCLRA